MRKILYSLVVMAFVILFVFASLFIFGTADIRTDLTRNKPNAAKGKALLDKAAISHGLEKWEEWETVQLKWSHEFAMLPAIFASPFPDAKFEADFSFTPGQWDSRLDFTSGKNKGTSWGIQNWNTYEKNTLTPAPVFAENADLKFWLPTYQYFVELPSRIFEADIILYAGEQEKDGKTYDGVYATWKSAEVQRNIDQYNLWIDRETGLIAWVDFTIRDFTNFAKGSVEYLDYKDFDGLKLATHMPVISPPLPGYLHQMRILDFIPNGIEIGELQPDQKLKGKTIEKE